MGGNEGNHCKYPTRLDTYGCGCLHDCDYCYAKSLLDFRGLWDAQEPAVANIDKIRRKIDKIDVPIVRMGGMTDCFQSIEKDHRVSHETIKALNERGIGYLIVTKSDLIADDDYIRVMDKDLAHIQVTVTCLEDGLYKSLGYEKAPLPSRRIWAIERLFDEGFDVQLRLSPFIPEYVDYEALSRVKCDKILVEFLRVNSWIKKWFNLDFSEYSVKMWGYDHLPLSKKLEYIREIKGFEEISVCEDEDDAYRYWREHFNPNKEDCCNLR